MTGPGATRPAADTPLWPVVAALGATQIVGYGTLYYSFAILAPAIAADFGAAPSTLFAILSVGLLCGGLAGPRLGRMMDRFGAPRLMTIGSGLAIVLLLVLAISPGLAAFGVGLVILEVVSVAVLYDAAFASLAWFAGVGARRSITHLTLIAGFASTIFWPLTGWLLDTLGWRDTYVVFALLQAAVALPLHILIDRRWRSTAAMGSEAGARESRSTARSPLVGREGKIAFALIAVGFALNGIVVSAISVHLVPILQQIGLGTGAFAASMLMGPTQVAIRLTDAVFWRSLHPLAVTIIGSAALPAALFVLILSPASFAAAASFAVAFGVGQGLQSIVKGTVPLALFGAAGYAERLGRLAALRIPFTALAPYLFSATWTTFGIETALVSLLAVAAVSVVPFAILRRRLASGPIPTFASP